MTTSLLIDGGRLKECFKCHEVLPLSGFYKHAQMGDGHLNKCKTCTRRDVRERYVLRLATEPSYRDAERARGRDKYARLYAVGPNWTSPDAPRDQKRSAQVTLGNAIRDGRIEKGTACQDCGRQNVAIHGHHTDYNKPLDVDWVCPACHRRRHALHPERVKGSA